MPDIFWSPSFFPGHILLNDDRAFIGDPFKERIGNAVFFRESITEKLLFLMGVLSDTSKSDPIFILKKVHYDAFSPKKCNTPIVSRTQM